MTSPEGGERRTYTPDFLTELFRNVVTEQGAS